ncbi:lateral flagellar export/assembly protein (FliP-like) [Escherichia coli]|uniref:Flagellar biosynthetic protein FliP n=1 Tax=Escherichia coli TaxID=562 RepID=A0A2X1Q222_ECOLX|nr:lateral flagellar export/assembly protein (FliP-like) [Escherichia coli]
MKRRTQLTLGLGLLALAPLAIAQGGDIALLNVVTHGNTQEYSVKIQVLILMTLVGFAADDGADDDLLCALYYRAVAAAPGARAATNAAKPHSDWHCALPHHAGDAPIWLNIYDHAVVPFRKRSDYPDRCVKHRRDATQTLYAGADRQKSDGANHDHRRREGNAADQDLSIVVPAYVLSELKTAFQIGFMIYIPFLVIDLIVASVLMAMGMMMLSPLIVSLPFKLMLFVLIDGWSLTIGTLTTSIRGLGLG